MAKKQSDKTNDDSNQDANASFEDALHRLADSVRQLEEGNLSLDESLARYEEGIRYLSQCQKILENAERKIELLSGFDADGNPIKKSVDDEELSLEQKADKRSQRRSAKPEVTTNTSPKTAKTRKDDAHVRQRRSAPKRTDSGDGNPAQAGPGRPSEQDDVDGNGRLF